MRFFQPILTAAILLPSLATAADPWADRVVGYDPGEGVGTDFVDSAPYTDAAVTLGEPTRYTSDSGNFGGAVSPFNSPFRADEIASVGRGGFLTVAFDEPVVDDPLNPFGIDLLVFGNAFYFDADYPNAIAGTLAAEGGLIEVSENGTDYFAVPGVGADGLFPTLGYSDTPAFSSEPGVVPTDFTRPVDPSFNPSGLGFDAILAGYNGSGGGAGVDLATVGLSQISYVRVSVAGDADYVPEINAFADVRAVPEPTAALIVLAGLALLSARRMPNRG